MSKSDLDVLFVSPLGWSRHIWDKICPFLEEKEVAFLDFLDHSYEQVNLEKIEEKLSYELCRLKPDGIVVAASFGVVVVGYYLSTHNHQCHQLILIDGFETLPTNDELNQFANQLPTNQYATLQDYYNSMLEENEQQDMKLLEILNHNLSFYQERYHTKLSNENMISYLRCYSNYSVKNTLTKIRQQVNQLIVYSSIALPIPHEKITPDNHLLMLTNPEILANQIANL